jgi:hypothetical protein
VDGPKFLTRPGHLTLPAPAAFLTLSYSVLLQTPRVGQPGLPGFGLDEAQREMVQRFEPDDGAVDSIGFFIARFVKRG